MASAPRALVYLSLLFAAALAHGETRVAGIVLCDEYTLAGHALQLNGAGIRSRWFVEVYVGALYLPAAASTPTKILQMPGPKSMHMHIVYKEVQAEQVAAAWRDGFEANLGEAAFSRIRPRLEAFNALFPTLHRGDSVRMDYVPGQGTSLSVNARTLGRIDGEDFISALLQVWIGAHPADEDLKRSLLKGG